MSGEEVVKAIPEEVEKIVISTDTVLRIFKDEYGRDVESVVFDKENKLWIVDFLMPAEAEAERVDE